MISRNFSIFSFGKIVRHKLINFHTVCDIPICDHSLVITKIYSQHWIFRKIDESLYLAIISITHLHNIHSWKLRKHNVVNWKNYSHRKNISSNQLSTFIIVKTSLSRNFCQNINFYSVAEKLLAVYWHSALRSVEITELYCHHFFANFQFSVKSTVY